jgi:hypothetical protein
LHFEILETFVIKAKRKAVTFSSCHTHIVSSFPLPLNKREPRSLCKVLVESVSWYAVKSKNEMKCDRAPGWGVRKKRLGNEGEKVKIRGHGENK